MDAKLYQASKVNDIDVVAKCLVFPEKNFLFQQDLTPSHRASSTNNYFKSRNIQVLDWPGNSTDINPIENIWAYHKRAMQQITCNSKEQLWKAVQHHWYSLVFIKIKSVINMKGNPTKY